MKLIVKSNAFDPIVIGIESNEYENSKFQNFFNENGIKHQTSASYTPQQNGVAERVNGIILDKVRCMLVDARLPSTYWAEAVNYAVYLKNRSPSRAIKNFVPETMWNNKPVDLSNLRIFGCVAFMHIPKEKRKKLEPKSKRMLFVGIFENSKAYRLIDPTKPTVVIKSRDVIFDETSFFFKQKKPITAESATDNVQVFPQIPSTTTNQPLAVQEIHQPHPSSSCEADALKAPSNSSLPDETSEDSATHDEPHFDEDDTLFESANSSSSTDSSQTSPDID